MDNHFNHKLYFLTFSLFLFNLSLIFIKDALGDSCSLNSSRLAEDLKDAANDIDTPTSGTNLNLVNNPFPKEINSKKIHEDFKNLYDFFPSNGDLQEKKKYLEDNLRNFAELERRIESGLEVKGMNLESLEQIHLEVYEKINRNKKKWGISDSDIEDIQAGIKNDQKLFEANQKILADQKLENDKAVNQRENDQKIADDNERNRLAQEEAKKIEILKANDGLVIEANQIVTNAQITKNYGEVNNRAESSIEELKKLQDKIRNTGQQMGISADAQGNEAQKLLNKQISEIESEIETIKRQQKNVLNELEEIQEKIDDCRVNYNVENALNKIEDNPQLGAGILKGIKEKIKTLSNLESDMAIKKYSLKDINHHDLNISELVKTWKSQYEKLGGNLKELE